MYQLKKVFAGLAALAALALGGSAIAGAATSTTTATSSTSSAQSASATPARPAFSGPAHGTPAHENVEGTITGTEAAKAQAAAVKQAGGGTAGPVTSDFTRRGYETTVTKSDGSTVEVHLDSSLNAMDGPGGNGAPPAAGSAG